MRSVITLWLLFLLSAAGACSSGGIHKTDTLLRALEERGVVIGTVKKRLIAQEIDNFANGVATQFPLPKTKDVTLNGVMTRLLQCPGGNAHAQKLAAIVERGTHDDDPPGLIMAASMVEGSSNWVYGPFIVSLSPTEANITELVKLRKTLDAIFK